MEKSVQNLIRYHLLELDKAMLAALSSLQLPQLWKRSAPNPQKG